MVSPLLFPIFRRTHFNVANILLEGGSWGGGGGGGGVVEVGTVIFITKITAVHFSLLGP